MEICMGMIGMAPSEFWNASVVEIHAAIEGFMEFNTDGSAAPMRRDELQDLMERYPD
jgi:uncharacterized phage protein (TIGR02216 family)